MTIIVCVLKCFIISMILGNRTLDTIIQHFIFFFYYYYIFHFNGFHDVVDVVDIAFGGKVQFKNILRLKQDLWKYNKTKIINLIQFFFIFYLKII